eukprot:11167662-Lingulodinium_polyedra.AAC.1
MLINTNDSPSAYGANARTQHASLGQRRNGTRETPPAGPARDGATPDRDTANGARKQDKRLQIGQRAVARE